METKKLTAKDFMIGDWVTTQGLIPNKKVNVRIVRLDEADELCNYEPITITAEILEKNGFKKSRRISYYNNVLGTWRSNKYDITIKQYFLTREKSVFVVNGGFSKIGNINFVHELQHALRLCGVDKEIML